MSLERRIGRPLREDIVLIGLSIGGAVVLAQTGVLAQVLASAEELQFLGSFIAGVFFTSVFTTFPAIVALGEIARIHSLLSVALLGAAGAVIGDFILFRFIRDRFSEHIIALIGHRSTFKRMHVLFKLRLFRWLSFFVGGLIIASPLPDELGLGLFGFSKMKTSWFILISFIFNFIGVLLIGLAARAL